MTHFIFDCDDVLLDWQTGFSDWLGKYHIAPPDPAGPQTWGLSEWLNCSQEQARRYVREFNASPAFGQLKACDHARDVVWGLQDEGHRASVLTACGTDRAVTLARYWNLMEAFDTDALEHDPFDSPLNRWCSGISFLPLGASKFDYLCRVRRSRPDLVFIEDNFAHAQSGVACGIKSYCLRRSHNRAEEAANPDSAVIWIDDLREVAA